VLGWGRGVAGDGARRTGAPAVAGAPTPASSRSRQREVRQSRLQGILVKGARVSHSCGKEPEGKLTCGGSHGARWGRLGGGDGSACKGGSRALKRRLSLVSCRRDRRHLGRGTAPALVGTHTQGGGSGRTGGWRGTRSSWYGGNDGATWGGRGIKAPRCMSPRENVGSDAEGGGATCWARAHVGRRRSRVPGHRSGQNSSSQRRFDRVFLNKFEVDENFSKNKSCSVKYPLQLLQRPSYVFLNGLSRNVERS
jgi:hypothetical protein